MGRKIAIGVLLAVAVLVVAAIVMRPEPGPIPPDADHLAALRAPDREAACLDCHGNDRKNPRPPGHPVANDCMRCHALR